MKLTQQNVFPPESVLLVCSQLPQNRPGSVLNNAGTAPANIKILLDVTNEDDAAAAVLLDAATKERILQNVPVYEMEGNGTNGENLEQIAFQHFTGDLADLPTFPGLGKVFAVRVPEGV